MEKYNYKDAMRADILEYLRENYTDENLQPKTKDCSREEFEEKLYDELWVADSVTGNASGSYTFSTWAAEENLCHNTKLLLDAIEEFGGDAETYRKALESAEYADVTIRCWLLAETLHEVLDDWWE